MNTLSKRPLSSSFNELSKGGSVSRDNELHYLKIYNNLTEYELILLHKKSFQNLQTMFRNNSKDLRESLLKNIDSISRGKPKKWKMIWKKDKKKKTVFGVPLINSLEYASVHIDSIENRNAKKIPIVIYECINYLKKNGLRKEGIFRVNGSERRINNLIKTFDQTIGYGYGYNFEGINVFDVASLLKLYLRQLPEPLIPFCLYNTTLNCIKIFKTDEDRIKAFQYLLMMLPTAHLVLLEVLLQFLSEVIVYADDNHMNSHNLACIFAPNLLRSKESSSTTSSTLSLSSTDEYEKALQVVEFLINNNEKFKITSSDVKPFQLFNTSVKDEFKSSKYEQLSPIHYNNEADIPSTPTTPTTPLTTPSTPQSVSLPLENFKNNNSPELNLIAKTLDRKTNNSKGNGILITNSNLQIPFSPSSNKNEKKSLMKPRYSQGGGGGGIENRPINLNALSVVSTSLNRLNYFELQDMEDDENENSNSNINININTNINTKSKTKANININTKTPIVDKDKEEIFSILSPLSTAHTPILNIPPPPLATPPPEIE